MNSIENVPIENPSPAYEFMNAMYDYSETSLHNPDFLVRHRVILPELSTNIGISSFHGSIIWHIDSTETGPVEESGYNSTCLKLEEWVTLSHLFEKEISLFGNRFCCHICML